jgi:hypothetical protein
MKISWRENESNEMKISSNENQKIWHRKWPAQLIINNVANASKRKWRRK